jgi:3-dehydroquinate dehydratase-1
VICVSLREPDHAAFVQALAVLGDDPAELRLDGARLTIAETEDLFARPARLVAAFRPVAGVPEKERREVLAAAVGAGAFWLDLEWESAAGWGGVLLPLARSRGCRIIISHHDESGTPSRERLEEIARACFAAGADIAKIACRVRERTDCARLLSLYGIGRPMIALGLGPLGLITRVAAPLLGAPFTYAAADGRPPTADGQPDRTTMRRLLASFERP